MKRLAETICAIRPACVSLIAMATVACAMAVKGWTLPSLLLAAVLVMFGWLLMLQVHRALNLLQKRSWQVAEAASRAERHYVEVLRRIVDFVEARDEYKRGHSANVARLAGKVGQRMGLPKETCRMLELAGQLHDIGLLAAPGGDAWRRKGARALREVRKHPWIAYEVLQPLPSLERILPAVLHHHERMNGTGYPRGLSAKDIPIEARILAVADSYDAMTHDRPNRPALMPLEAVEELRRCSPSGYDSECVEALAVVANLVGLEDLIAAPEEPIPAVAP